MKLHSDVHTMTTIYEALQTVRDNGTVTRDVGLWKFEAEGSRKRARGFEVQLGTHDQTSGPTKSRHYKNSGNSGSMSNHPWHGTERVWAATYDEWGWFIAELFRVDPKMIFGNYDGVADFNHQTKFAYTAPVGSTIVEQP